MFYPNPKPGFGRNIAPEKVNIMNHLGRWWGGYSASLMKIIVHLGIRKLFYGSHCGWVFSLFRSRVKAYQQCPFHILNGIISSKISEMIPNGLDCPSPLFSQNPKLRCFSVWKAFLIWNRLSPVWILIFVRLVFNYFECNFNIVGLVVFSCDHLCQ